MFPLCLLLLSILLRGSFAVPQPTKYTLLTPNIRITETELEWPAGSADDGGPLRYNLYTYFQANNTFAGQVFAELCSNGELELVVLNHKPQEDGPYFGNWSFSVEPENHDEVSLNLSPTQGLPPDGYRLSLCEFGHIQYLDIITSVPGGCDIAYPFHVVLDTATNELIHNDPEGPDVATLVITPTLDGQTLTTYLDYVSVQYISNASHPVFIKAVKVEEEEVDT